MNEIKITIAANITYSGFTYNTPLILEYKHTGKMYFYKKKRQKYETYTTDIEIAENKRKEGLQVREENGYYFIKRMAIPNIDAKGNKSIWYINNSGDTYSINKVSKYGKKMHELLSKNINPLNS